MKLEKKLNKLQQDLESVTNTYEWVQWERTKIYQKTWIYIAISIVIAVIWSLISDYSILTIFWTIWSLWWVVALSTIITTIGSDIKYLDTKIKTIENSIKDIISHNEKEQD